MLNRMDGAGVEIPRPKRESHAEPRPVSKAQPVTVRGLPTDFLQIARLAARLARTPIGLVSSGKFGQAWSEPALGLVPEQIGHLYEIGQHLDGTPAAAVIPDATQDPRLWHNPNVSGAPNLRFVACVPLTGAKGESLGVLAVMDVRPRARLSDEHADALADLAMLATGMLERAAEAEAQARSTRGTARTEQIDAAVIRAQSCELALAAMLVSLCKHHGATAGFVGKLAGSSRVMQEVCHYNDESGLGDYFARTAALAVTPETSQAALAIHSGTPRTLVFSGADALTGHPTMAEAIRTGLRAEVIQPVHLLDEKFGIVLMFDSVTHDLEAIAADVDGMVRMVRPALYRKAAERRMRLLGTALDRANDAVLITEAGPLGASGPRIVYANASFCRESGYALEEIIGQPHGMLHGAGTDAAAVARLRQEMRRWKPARAELLNYRKDGAEFWAEMDLTPITDEAGLPTHWISIQRDVTERRADEAAQRRHAASFRMLFEDNPLPMVVMDRESLRFLEVNDAAAAQYGWTRAELLTKTLVDLDQDGDEERAQALATGALGDNSSTTHMRDDGSVLEVRAFVHDTVYSGQDATLAVLWDVTDLEAARRDMHQANEMLRERTLQLHARTEELGEAQRLARLGTWRISVERQEVSWSKEMYELMGLPRDAAGLSPESLIQRIHPEDRDIVRDALTTTPHQKVSRNFEYRVILPDEQVRHLRAEVRPVLDDAGRVIELFGYSQDISDRKRAEAALLRNESLRALGQLTGGVAHDFNNLLTVVILNLEEAQEVLPETHEMQEVLAPALHAAVRGAELTSQLLSYARRATLRPERVRPRRVLRRSSAPAQPGAGGTFRATGPAAAQWRQRHGRPGPARQRHHEPGHQRPRRHAAGRHDRARDALYHPGGQQPRLPGRGHTWPLCRHQRERQGRGHPRTPAVPGVRAVLHHEGGRQGQRHGPEHGVWLRPSVGRPRHHRQRAGPRHDRAPVPARGAGECRGAGAAPRGDGRVDRRRPARPGRRGPGERVAHRDPDAAATRLRRDGRRLGRSGARPYGWRAGVRLAVHGHRSAGGHGRGRLG